MSDTTEEIVTEEPKIIVEPIPAPTPDPIPSPDPLPTPDPIQTSVVTEVETYIEDKYAAAIAAGRTALDKLEANAHRMSTEAIERAIADLQALEKSLS